ncbi:hypothetical protein VTN00DRAFT_9077 [Thermoascus crustaceus]|uniref:uncharacterized protein n=1 Tax=Thermoascus crustaceus TaxID=5088 RepID=UPI00374471B1
MTGRKAVVVGAGVGGLSIAARLRKAGFAVTVVEKNSFVGGRCSLIRDNGYRFDQGPSFLLMPEIFEETFRDLGTSLRGEGIRLLKSPPNYRVWFGDDDFFELSTQMPRLKHEIEYHEGREGFGRFIAYMEEARQHYELFIEHVLKKDFPSFLSMLRPAFLRSVFNLHPFESMRRRTKKYFHTEKLRQVFAVGSRHLGMSPFDAPGMYSFLQYAEIADGVWYPEGGFYRVIDALAQVGNRLGVEFLLETAVSRINISRDGKSATGVKLSSGESLDADIVVVNADLVYAYNELLPRSSYAESLQKTPTSCSSISFYWSFDTVIKELPAHNVFLPKKYAECFESIFIDHLIPTHPFFYVDVPSRVDLDAAPPGGDAVVVIVPVGHLPHRVRDWDELIFKIREGVIDTIESRTGARSLRNRLLHERIDTPMIWRAKFNLDRGAIFGLSHSFFNTLSFRPRTKHDEIEGLYFVGASTHPGAGVPMCLAGSKIVSEQILESYGLIKKKKKGPSKRARRYLVTLSILLSVFVCILLARWIYSIWGTHYATSRAGVVTSPYRRSRFRGRGRSFMFV